MSDDLSTGADRIQELAVVVVAGGRGTRLGGTELGDKASMLIDGEPLLTTVLRRLGDALSKDPSAEPNGPGTTFSGDVRADPDCEPPGVRVVMGPVVVVGPAGLAGLVPDVLRDSVAVVQEQPPGSGPLAAVAAGVGMLDCEQHRTVAIVGGDMLHISDALEPLQDALANSACDAAVLVDGADRVDYLGAVWRTSRLLEQLTRFDSLADRRLADLYEHAVLVWVSDIAGWSRDIDSSDELPD